MKLPLRILSDWSRTLAIRLATIWLAAVTIFQCVDVFENLRDYTQAGASDRELLTFLLLRTPELAFQVLPAAVLLGVLLGMYHLARHKELTAAEAAGMHPAWLLGVALGLGGVLAAAQLALETGPLPHLRALSDRYQAVRIERNPLRLETPVRWAVAGSELWRIETHTPGQYAFERYRRDGDTLDVVRLDDVAQEGDAWEVSGATQLRWSAAITQAVATPYAGAVAIPFLPAEVAPLRPRVRHETLGALRELASRKMALTGEVSQAALELHQRLSWALMSVTVLLAIVPYVPRHGRRASTAGGVLLALCIGIACWAVVVFGTAWAGNEKALAGYWLPHGFLLLTGLAGSTRIRSLLS